MLSKAALAGTVLAVFWGTVSCMRAEGKMVAAALCRRRALSARITEPVCTLTGKPDFLGLETDLIKHTHKSASTHCFADA